MSQLDVRKGEVLRSVEKRITQSQIQKYAEASGDFNPVHVDPMFAASSRFGGTIAHGMMIAAAISEAMTAAFGAHWMETGKLKIRFRAPVSPGDTINTFGKINRVIVGESTTEVRCSVGVKRQTGESVIAGEAMVNLSHQKR